MKRVFLLTSAFVSLALLAAACGSPDPTDSEDGRDTTPAPAAANTASTRSPALERDNGHIESSPPPSQTGDGSDYAGDTPVRSLEASVARNHLIIVGHVTADAGTREYSHIGYKADPAGEVVSGPGFQTVLREVTVERVVKGAVPGGAKTILVEELGITPVTVGGNYLFLLGPWHNDTYQAGAYGAIALDGQEVSLGSGAKIAIGHAELAGLSPDEAIDRVASMVADQRSRGFGELAVVGPAPLVPFNAYRLFSLAAASAVSAGGQPLTGAGVDRLRGDLDKEVMPTHQASAGEREPVVVSYASGQRLTLEFEPSSGLLFEPGDPDGIPLTEDALSVLE